MIEAQNLPDTDTAFFNISNKDYTDPFATLEVGTARLLKTKYVNNDLSPRWDEKFNLNVCHRASVFEFKVRDKDHIGAALVGTASINAEDLISGKDSEVQYHNLSHIPHREFLSHIHSGYRPSQQSSASGTDCKSTRTS